MYDNSNDNNKNKLIVDLSEIFEHKQKKQKELQFYQKELEKLQFKMSLVSREIALTQDIINLIEQEKVVDLVDMMQEKIIDLRNPGGKNE